ncbi:MAG: aconitase family protein [Rhodopseudomonas palustris]|nr:aconitase family protein [Rhodopseudomonas palustris]
MSALNKAGIAPHLERLPFSVRILLEGVLRSRGRRAGHGARRPEPGALERGGDAGRRRCPSCPRASLLQDLTGVPAVVDLAAMRDGDAAPGRRPGADQPARPGRPGHRPLGPGGRLRHARRACASTSSSSSSATGSATSSCAGARRPSRTSAWCRPATGIVHQVNLEFLAKVVMTRQAGRRTPVAFPDTLVGTDSHTTMINGLGVLGWGVGGIEAEAVMLGQPLYMLTPAGRRACKLTGELREGVTATDLVLTVTQMLRKKGVVEKFVEFYGAGPRPADACPTGRRSANMAPEYGATMRLLPGGRRRRWRYLRRTGRRGRGGRPGRALRARSRACSGTDATPDPEFTDDARARPRRRSSPAWPGPSARRTACRSPQMKTRLPAGAHGAASRSGASAWPPRRRPGR